MSLITKERVATLPGVFRHTGVFGMLGLLRGPLLVEPNSEILGDVSTWTTLWAFTESNEDVINLKIETLTEPTSISYVDGEYHTYSGLKKTLQYTYGITVWNDAETWDDSETWDG